MLKRILSLLFCGILAYSSAFAVNSPPLRKPQDNMVISDNSDSGFNPKDYNFYTIEFPSNSYESFSETHPLVTSNIKAAEEYVYSLELSKQGYKCIENACLAQLSFLEDQNCLLTSYTVLTPKSGTPRLYGTYNSKKFYYEWYSSYSTRFEKNVIPYSSKLQKWASGALDLVLCFANAEITVPFTLIKNVSDYPSDYIVKSPDSADYNADIDATCRALYVDKSNSSTPDYKLLAEDESGSVVPYIDFHPHSNYAPRTISWQGTTRRITTLHFDDKTYMLKHLYHLYQYSNLVEVSTFKDSVNYPFEFFFQS